MFVLQMCASELCILCELNDLSCLSSRILTFNSKLQMLIMPHSQLSNLS